MRRLLYRLHLLHSPSLEMLGKCWCQKGQKPPELWPGAVERGGPH